VTDCEGQSIVEANGVRFSVLQVNMIGHCILWSRVRCGDCHRQPLLDSCGVKNSM
jgi:hypothetical protein